MFTIPLIASGLVGCLAAPAAAEVRLPALFNDHLVLQRDLPIPVWGWAGAGEEVTVSLAGQTAKATADAEGRWQAKLQPLSAGGPHTLSVVGSSTVTINDVLIGEVWLCSGQSNMAMTVGGVNNAQEEIAAANYPQIRMATVARETAETPQADCSQAQWKVCSPETVGGFSATAYFTGRHLHQHLKVPVGLINASWGGTCIEAWTPTETLAQLESGRTLLTQWEERLKNYDAAAAQQAYDKQLASWPERKKAAVAAGRRPPRKPRPPVSPARDQNRPGNLYNGMLAPLVGYGIRGALWYQGERNANSLSDAFEYRDELPAMVQSWRRVWGQGDFPFLWVQLPNFAGKDDDVLSVNRESMRLALQTPNTGMAITIDVGDSDNIHPKNKQAVGERLGLLARKLAYGEDLVASGPLYKGMKVSGNRVTLFFDSAGGGLEARDGALREFVVAGADKQFVPAQAEVEGDTVVVWSNQVAKPVAVRYGWAADPKCNLFNKEGLPASPFRTDDWPIEVPKEPAK